ncbi:type II toxin-antitoxin system VapC family toxin [Ottowia testudinis]|uniref:Ribonuclease VapC n=1 Tax=Ottowia testudinis TaxID=2816950 RepID=A0A975CF63_9BURK|nr:type II toxin-antitoxin system VapC family toxin [Ottowia testudinis]QTD45323.1 type II toxin-antitoxin system VapC family toxin [Ottowia testudinis]
MAQRVLVDTDVLIDHLRGVEQATQALLVHDRLAISVITLAELLAGAKGAREQADIDALAADCEVLPVDEPTARVAGILRKRYGPSHGVQLPDALIAAAAQTHQLPLLTLNSKHYPMLPGLRPAYRKSSGA